MNNIRKYINLDKLKNISFKNQVPFDHVVIDDFLDFEFAKKIEREFFSYDSEKWHVYSNPIEEKKTCNVWNSFESNTYILFHLLNSEEIVNMLSSIIGEPLFPDIGLHGGGLHIHGKGGNLNPHLDYSIHPKLDMQRKLNIIIYVSSDEMLEKSKEGSLGLWSGDGERPNELVKEVSPKFNRAIIFDTTQNSWHGIVKPLSNCAEYYRKSLAIYYLRDKPKEFDPRSRALFSPRESQLDDQDIQSLIKARASEKEYASVYKK